MEGKEDRGNEAEDQQRCRDPLTRLEEPENDEGDADAGQQKPAAGVVSRMSPAAMTIHVTLPARVTTFLL